MAGVCARGAGIASSCTTIVGISAVCDLICGSMVLIAASIGRSEFGGPIHLLLLPVDPSGEDDQEKLPGL